MCMICKVKLTGSFKLYNKLTTCPGLKNPSFFLYLKFEFFFHVLLTLGKNKVCDENANLFLLQKHNEMYPNHNRILL